jgi:hypothetical protein
MNNFKKIYKTSVDVIVPPPGALVNIQKAGSSWNASVCNLNGTITSDTLYTSDGNIADGQFVWADASLTIPYVLALGVIKKVGVVGIFNVSAGQAHLECNAGGGC